jgi:uncharacterized protein (UPF0276 family)
MTINDSLASIPILGSGIGYRQQIAGPLSDRKDEVDFVEIITDQFTRDAKSLDALRELRKSFAVIPHGIGLSIGSALPLDREYLDRLRAICDVVQAPYYSEHLCMTRAPAIDIGHLSPLWFTNDVLQIAIRNVSEVQEYLGRVLVLENITYLFEIPGGSMSQEEFFRRLTNATGCGVLLDVTNLYINSVNHDFDPVDALHEMPLDSIVQAHLAGGYWSDDVLIDAHSERVDDDTWRLFCAAAELVDFKASIVEHDANFPEDFNVLLDEVKRARHILDNSRNRFKKVPITSGEPAG